MKKYFLLFLFFLFLSASLIVNISICYADFIPSNDNGLYYRIGGGQGIPMPAYSSTQTVPLNVEGDIGLGYNCGVFNPGLSITDSLNDIKDSFQHISQGVVDNATAAVTEFPMYIVARANPELYNLLNNGLLEAEKDLEVSTKSCQVMQNEIATGKNPYTDWATVAMGDDWKYHMSLSSSTALEGEYGDTSDGDINQAKNQIEKDNGANGVPWVQGIHRGMHGVYAGGKGQPVIKVAWDTAIAGYNVTLQTGRPYDDTAAPAKTPKNTHLVETWANPTLAAKWITNVVGDSTITTYQGGDKKSVPGVGLLPGNQELTEDITKKLQGLVTGQNDMTLQHLQDVSAPGVMINEQVIYTIREQSPLMRTIITDKLGQEIAASKIIDKALLAKQILQEGSQVPAIFGNAAAQKDITKALTRLKQDIDNFLFNINVKKQLVSNTVSVLLSSTSSEQAARASIQTNGETPPFMDQGAIKKGGAKP